MSETLPHVLPTPLKPGRSTSFWKSTAAVIALAALVFVGVHHLRAPGSPKMVDPSPKMAMPVSRQIENTFGVRFDSAHIIASGGMIELRYTILDDTKAPALHNDGSLPYVQIGSRKFDQPGISGHGHGQLTPDTGRVAYLLLANEGEEAQPGQVASIHVGNLELDGVVLQG